MSISKGIFYFESFLFLVSFLWGQGNVKRIDNPPNFPAWHLSKIDSLSSTLLQRWSQLYTEPGGESGGRRMDYKDKEWKV